MTSGARYGELTALNAGDLDLDNGTAHIRKSKTGNGRHVILNDEGLALFERLTAGRPGDAAIFRKASGQRWLRSHQIRPFKAACRSPEL